MSRKETEAMAKELALGLAMEFGVSLSDKQQQLDGEALFDYVATTILMRGDQSSVDLLHRMRLAMED